MCFIRRHCFNLLISLFILGSMGITLIIAFAPKEDKLKRGFIACTNQLADKVTGCQGDFWCAGKAVFANTACDIHVIAKGVQLWLEGKQPKPWSNYFFTPDLSHLQNILNENAELFYQENPSYRQDFEDLKKQYELLEEQTENDKQNNE